MTARVDQLLMTPVKGFEVREQRRVEVTENGVVGNRDFFMMDDRNLLYSAADTGALMSRWARYRASNLEIWRDERLEATFPVELGPEVRTHFFEDRFVDGRVVLGDVNGFLSDLVSRNIRLVKATAPSGGYDVDPVTLVSRASVAALGEERDQRPLDVRRFRLNITLDGVDRFAEDEWIGRTISAGTAALRVGEPVPRCVATTRNATTGMPDVDVLHRIRRVRGVAVDSAGYRGLNLGVYATVLQPGVIAVGDHVSIE